MASTIQKNINYTKTGTGTSASNPGFENGPLQKWITQPGTPADAGFESKFDFGTSVLTTLIPEVVFGGWREISTTTNTYNFPRGERFESSDISTSYTLTEPTKLEALSGRFDNVYLDRIMAVKKVMQKFEILSTGADFLGFIIGEAHKGLSRKYEDITVQDLIAGGTDGKSLLVRKTDTEKSVDMYKTLLNIRTQILTNGSDINNIRIYCTPEIIAKMMTDGVIIANGQSRIQSEEVRYGFQDIILGMQIYVSGRLSGMTLPTPADIIVLDITQVYLIKNPVKALALEVLPAPYIDSIALQSLEYFKHYVANKNGVYFINTLATPATK